MQERCYYCNKQVMMFKSCDHKLVPHNARSKDHMTPVCRGGAGMGMVVCCTECNNDKARLTLEEYRVVRAYRMGIIAISNFKFPGEK